jgi:hypothetical protein
MPPIPPLSLSPEHDADARTRIQTALRQAQREVRDAGDCLDIAQADLAGEHPEIDALDRALGDGTPPDRRVRAMCLQAAEDLERAATRLRRAARGEPGEQREQAE